MPNKIFEWNDTWRRQGFNNAITTAEKLLQHIGDGNQPSGYGNSEYNRECFLQTVNELKITRRDILVPAVEMIEKIKAVMDNGLSVTTQFLMIKEIMDSKK